MAQRPLSGSPTQPSSPCGLPSGSRLAPFAGSIAVGGLSSPHAAAEPDQAAARVPDQAAAVLHGEASSSCKGLPGAAPEPDLAQLCARTLPAAVPAREDACAAAAERAERASTPPALAAAVAAVKLPAGSDPATATGPHEARSVAAPPAKGYAKPVLAPVATQGRWRARGAGCTAGADTKQPGHQGPSLSPGADQLAGRSASTSAREQQREHCADISSPPEGRCASRIPSCRAVDPAERRAASLSPAESQCASRIKSCRSSSSHAEDGAASSSPGADQHRVLGRRDSDREPLDAGASGPGRVQRAASCWEGRLASTLG